MRRCGNKILRSVIHIGPKYGFCLVDKKLILGVIFLFLHCDINTFCQNLQPFLAPFPGVNFINILRAAFVRPDPESAKKTDNLTVFFALLGSVCITDVKYNLDWSLQINRTVNNILLPGRIFKFSVIRFETEYK